MDPFLNMVGQVKELFTVGQMHNVLFCGAN